jgi:hypothetical protein
MLEEKYGNEEKVIENMEEKENRGIRRREEETAKGGRQR